MWSSRTRITSFLDVEKEKVTDSPTYPAICHGQSTSEHPPARSDCGMDYVAYLVNQVMQSQGWQSSVIIITWDDYGDFYDHVAHLRWMLMGKVSGSQLS